MVERFGSSSKLIRSGFQHELEISVDSNNPPGRVARQLSKLRA
jgi:hypothetical protein